MYISVIKMHARFIMNSELKKDYLIYIEQGRLL